MACADHLDRASSAHGSETSLLGLPMVAGVLKRLAWLTAGSAVLAISAGPLFAPAFASGAEKDEVIRVKLERSAPAHDGFDAVKCRSHTDGRNDQLLEIASDQLGGAPVEHVATRFWAEGTGEAEVTFEVWYGGKPDERKLFIGRGTVDMVSCEAALTSIS